MLLLPGTVITLLGAKRSTGLLTNLSRDKEGGKTIMFLKVMVFLKVGKGALADVRKRNQKKVLRVSADEDAALKEERFLRNLVNAAEDAPIIESMLNGDDE